MVRAHDVDDTTLEITLIALVVQNSQTVMHPVDTLTIPSQKDLYIYEARAEVFEDILHNKKANVTVTVFNEGGIRSIGDLEVEVWYYYMAYSDYENAENANTIDPDKNWAPTLTLNAIAVDDITEPFFVVHLFYKGEYIDEFSFIGYD
jgi:hypothetical protein